MKEEIKKLKEIISEYDKKEIELDAAIKLLEYKCYDKDRKIKKLKEELSDKESKWVTWCRQQLKDQAKKICDEIYKKFYYEKIILFDCSYLKNVLSEIQKKYFITKMKNNFRRKN